MISKAIEYALIALVALVTLLFFNDRIKAHYQAPLIAKHKAAEKEAAQLNSKRESENKQRATDASTQKIKRLEGALAAASAANASAIGLRDNLRDSAALGADKSACLQYANTVNNILRSGEELARRIAKEADGHVIDKVACTDSFPK